QVPQMKKWKEKDIDKRVDELLEMVGLEPEKYKNRKPDELSGGQRQRVGVIRALAADPPVILMDEPFSALDPISREKLQDDLIELQTKIKKTIIFVTHDIQEAMKLGDKICLLNEGHIEQIDTPEGFKNNPQSEFVKQFMGSHLEDDAPCVEENAIIRDLDIMKPIDEVTSMSAYPIVYDNQPIEVLYQLLSESERVIVMQEDSVGQYVIDRKDIFKYLSQKKEVAQHD
ncbi:ATP-binding cassette domain-containing protein, partial [Staphylococcus aureus]|nr:ATP-binding cassette domain-containing protein [Staphylococcus aureus]